MRKRIRQNQKFTNALSRSFTWFRDTNISKQPNSCSLVEGEVGVCRNFLETFITLTDSVTVEPENPENMNLIPAEVPQTDVNQGSGPRWWD